MRRVIYGCAMSLDGYVAGPNGEYDWIVTDPSIDFVARMAKFDALLVGRKTFDAMMKAGRPTMLGIKTFVFSRTLKPSDDADVSIYADAERVVAELRTKSGKDIALFGGGQLFRSLLAAGQVDRIEISVIPVLLGGLQPSELVGCAVQLGIDTYRSVTPLKQHNICTAGYAPSQRV